jgi:hypothetical protein
MLYGFVATEHIPAGVEVLHAAFAEFEEQKNDKFWAFGIRVNLGTVARADNAQSFDIIELSFMKNYRLLLGR